MATEQNQADQNRNEDNVQALGDAIIKGARNEDQIDKMRQAAAQDGEDDLNEIRAADDLDEPDPEAGYQPTGNGQPDETQNKQR